MSREASGLPWASRPAAEHRPTRRAIRRRLVRQAALIFVLWPALILVAPLSGDKRLVPLFALVLVIGLPILLPLNIVAAVTALRIHRALGANAWRVVRCEAVPAGSHGWRPRAYEEQPDGREIQVPAVLRFGEEVLRASPFKRYVDAGITELWCAGHPRHGAVMSEPGGAHPFRLVRHESPSQVVAPSNPR